jgi:hypothetical protein
MINKTLLLLMTLTFLSVNASWAGSSITNGLSLCGLEGAVFDDADDGKKEEGKKGKKNDGEEEPDCE